MPSIVTHHYFAKDVLNKLPNNKKINQKIFFIFAQSFDNLFYYKFFTPWQGKKIRKLGNLAQKKNINLYFQNILDYITDNYLENNQDLISYLYGSICHYVLDRFCHPFIIYNTGFPEINIKYRGLHEKMEVNIDAYIYQKKTNRSLKNDKLANTLLPKEKFSQDLKNIINYAYFHTFNIENMANIYQKSVKTGNFILKYFVTDTTGIKKNIYKLKDLIMFKSKRRYEYLSFNVSKIDKNYLNLNHDTWYYPTKPSLAKTDSFDELYEKALIETINIIKNINYYFEKKLTKQQILKIIGNYSYVTGLNENLPIKSIKFKF